MRKVVFLAVILLVILLLFFCDKSTDPQAAVAEVDISIIADGFGNHDGAMSDYELVDIVKHFNHYTEAWAIGAIMLKYRDSHITYVSSLDLILMIQSASLAGPYNDEKDLRDQLKGLSIRTPRVGIYVIRYEEECAIVRFFRAPGARIGEQEWTELTIL
jgi:hypothetical protein